MRTALILILIFGFVSSCSDDDDNSTTIITETVTLKDLESYQYDLGSFGDEEGAGILVQAEHYEISELEEDSDRNIIYTYQPQEGFKGNDYVELKTGRGSDGARPNTEIIFIQITFNINQ